jgi:scyllo-inositol 2-dehydrogenase (NADP+)
MKQIKTAIIGLGRSGRNIHGHCLMNMQDKYKITAVVDPIEERRKRAENEFNCESFDSYRSLIGRNDIDIVVNATPSHLHVPLTLELLKGGFNVLCEKPLARKAEEVDRMIDAAREYGKLLAVFQQARFAPYFQQVKKIIGSGDLGRILQISIYTNSFARRWDWQCLQSLNGGKLLNTGPHPLDQALELFGNDMEPEVVCIMDKANVFGDAEDYVKLILKGPKHPVIDLEISSCCAYPCFTFNIQASNGGLKGSMDHIDWMFFKSEEAPKQSFIRTPLINKEGTPAYCSEQLKWYERSWDVPEEQEDQDAYMCKSFYDMIYRNLTEDIALEITPAQVRRQIAVIEECHRQNPFPHME